MRTDAALWTALAAGLGACLSGENVDLGHNVDANAPPAAPGLDAALLSEGGAPVLGATISATKGSICRGACVQLVASATGASGPFVYAWGQGLGEGAGPKSVCPVATTTYSVTVSSTSSEQQSTGSTTITVLPCDAGAPSSAPPPVDAGVTPARPDAGGGPPITAALCVPNPSFEGTPLIGTSGPPGIPPTAAPPQWQVCIGDPDVDPSVSLQPPSDGKTYVGLAIGSGAFASMAESLGTTLCAPLQAGTHYSFCIDLGLGVQGVMAVPPAPGTPAPTLELWGGKASCNQDELLWTSPPITNRDSWTTVCGAFVPSQALATISLLPAQAPATAGPGAWSYVIADHMVAGP